VVPEKNKPVKEMIWIIPVTITLIFLYSLLTLGVGMAEPLSGNETGLLDVVQYLNLYYIRLQALWFGLGVLLMIAAMVLDYKIYGELHKLIYWASMALLAAVFILGESTRGAQAWFAFENNRTLQPSEFVKISMIVFLAKEFSKYENGMSSFKELIPLLLYTLLPVGLIVLQNDYGTAAVYVVIFVVMLFLSGTSWRLILPLCAAGGAALPVLWFFVLDDTQKVRFTSFLNPEADVSGAGYHVVQSKIAIGSGQLQGKGLFSTGVMSQLDYIPDKHTDFIFSTVCETFGFLGAMLLIALYALLIFRLLVLAYNTKDKFGSLIVVGVLSMQMFHIFENIGMTIGIMPVTGIPLPFMSYGGSSMFANLIAIGLALNVGLRRHKTRYYKKNIVLKFVPSNLRTMLLKPRNK